MSRRHIFGLFLALGLVLGALAVAPFIPALLWATCLSVLAFPIARRASRFGANGSALLATLATGLILAIPVVLIGVGVGLQASNLADHLQGQNFNTVTSDAEKALLPIAKSVGINHLDLREMLQKNGGEIATSLRPALTKVVAGTGTTILTLVIALLTQFFLIRDGAKLKAAFMPFSPLEADRTAALLERAAETIRAVFVGTVLVATIQGAIMGVAFAFAGLSNALLLGVAAMILCVIPLLGAPVLYLPIGAALLLSGNTTGGLIVLGTGLIIVSQVDNVMKPFVIGGRVSLHPMAIFFSILGGTILFGPIGVMAGPTLLTVILGLLEAYRDSAKPEDGTI